MVVFDEFGPEKVLEFYDAKTGLHGFLVIDNTSLGPGKGGISISDVNINEMFYAARTMTWKCSLADLPFGGAKSGIIVPNGISKSDAIIWFANQIKEFASFYVATPDINSSQNEMNIFAETIGNERAATGKSINLGGLPCELGLAGFGVTQSLLATLKYLQNNGEISVAIEGFGNVGFSVSKFISESGIKIVAVSDSKGCIYDPNGLDIEKLVKIKREIGSVISYNSSSSKVFDKPSLFELDVDVLIPASKSNSINEKNFNSIKADIIIEASSNSMLESLEEKFYKKGIVVIPDFVANAGGAISSSIEYNSSEKPTSQALINRVFKEIEEKISKNTKLVLEKADRDNMSARRVGIEIAKETLCL